MADKEPEITAADGTVRKAHYGAGKQPWDTICELGWGAVFAAGNVLKYIRRYMMKNGDDDIAKARWYWDRLQNMTEEDFPSRMVLGNLIAQLTEEERTLLIS